VNNVPGDPVLYPVSGEVSVYPPRVGVAANATPKRYPGLGEAWYIKAIGLGIDGQMSTLVPIR
jgi:hypothetical protein